MVPAMPGTPVQVFTENRPAGLVLAIAGAVCLLVGLTKGHSGWIFLGVLLLAIGLFWLLPVRLELYPDRISYRSFFRSREMRLDALERFYYRIVEGGRIYSVSAWGVSRTGTRYSYKLVDDRGQTISLGMRMQRPKELGDALIEYTRAPLIRKCTQALDMGCELDFGSIRLSRAEGLKVRKPGFLGLGHHTDHIPLDQVSQFDIRTGRFYIWRRGEKRTKGLLIRNIPNAFVLRGLLETLCPSALSGHTAQVR
jgi:hypothetical protein